MDGGPAEQVQVKQLRLKPPLASTFLFVKRYRPKQNKPEVLQD